MHEFMTLTTAWGTLPRKHKLPAPTTFSSFKPQYLQGEASFLRMFCAILASQGRGRGDHASQAFKAPGARLFLRGARTPRAAPVQCAKISHPGWCEDLVFPAAIFCNHGPRANIDRQHESEHSGRFHCVRSCQGKRNKLPRVASGKCQTPRR